MQELDGMIRRIRVEVRLQAPRLHHVANAAVSKPSPVPSTSDHKTSDHKTSDHKIFDGMIREWADLGSVSTKK